ncbi:MAG: prepilin peptidase [Roseburia sp.]
MIVSYALMAMLAVCSLEDIRHRQVNCIPVLMWGVVGVVFHILWHQQTVYSMAAGLLPGIILLVIALISGGAIGIGDGLVVIVMGIFLGGIRNLQVLCVALVLSAVISLGLLVMKKKNKRDSIPFIPCLLVAYLGVFFYA